MKVINGVTIRLISLMLIGFLGTFIHDYLDSLHLFGDYIADRQIKSFNDYEPGDRILGARHLWYFWGCAILFVLGIVRTIVWADVELKKIKQELLNENH